MDLVYIPEVLTYGSFRNPQYHDYEQPWNRDCFGYGRSTSARCQRFQKKQQPLPEHYQQRKQVSKENCHLCRESKRRSLALYIRGKSRQSSCQEIHEDIEEEKEEEEDEAIGVEKEDNASENYDKNVSLFSNNQKQCEESEKFANKCATRT
ncbi:hypothetical protein KPH14_011670 [Odynerus spinipes]|uniref:Uncharacterized protein n=1 Tax=Odynerus spinipes TaxID=1348599 RepID=A0AAD9VL95_9HYME|nr:hypothetical protein KPH14_011670 [Odynerus spinipes]